MKKKRKKIHKPSRSNYLLKTLVVIIFIVVLYPFITAKKIPCANSISCKEKPKFEVETNATGIFHSQVVSVPNISLLKNEDTSPVLGLKTSLGEKRIYVNLATQTLSAYQGDQLFMQTLISSGLWGRTPKGDFTIWAKFRATRMAGGSGADYYDLPNVPYVMFFSNDEVSGDTGFSLHGTYWHNNFGHAMSHGCVNMKTTDAGKIFDWADGPIDGQQGTKITIYGDLPE
ncbi:MAG: L,D-transpeptidase [Patescibacteria group bacterium]